MKKTSIAILAAITSLTFSGCYTHGHDFDISKVPQIRKGITTEAELVEMFGEPTQRGLIESGETMLTWSYSRTTIGAAYGISDAKHKGVMVFLDKDGKVTKFSSNGN